jgi:hypothetical protein
MARIAGWLLRVQGQDCAGFGSKQARKEMPRLYGPGLAVG